jgi:hypothetical protein
VLGLAIATVSALVPPRGIRQNTFDTTEAEITQRGAKVMLLDRLLADYGPETKPAREQLRKTVGTMTQIIWPEEKSEMTGQSGLSAYESMSGMEELQMMLFELTPTTEAQRQLFSMAHPNILELRESRWLLIEQSEHIIPIPFLVVLLCWLTILHVSFGLLAPRSATAVTVLLISAISVAGAIFIILEMTHPLQGSIKASSAPMRRALEHLGQ